MSNPEEYRRTRRIVDLLLRIANQPRRWTRRALAERYEVTERQVDKDLSLIRHGLVMPLRHCPEGYYFERFAHLPVLTLSLTEALSLLLAARLGRQMPGVSQGDLAAALGRLEALLPAELLPLVSGLGRGDGHDDRKGAALRDLQLAIAERARLRLLYRSASHPDSTQHSALSTQHPDRLVDPYTLLPYQRSWYLVGHCHLRNQVRIFKVDRIERMSRTAEHFAFPRDFEVGSYLGPIWGLLRGEAGDPEEVVLEFVPEAGRWMKDQELHDSQRVEELPDGTVRMTFHIGITPEFRRWVFGFGRQLRVVKPTSLAEWVREEASVVGEGQAREELQLEVGDGR